MKFDELIGHRVVRVLADDDLYLETDKGMFICEAEGD